MILTGPLGRTVRNKTIQHLFYILLDVYYSPIDAYNPDLKKYPKFSKAQAISFEQNPGELLIIPPGWFHQVMYARRFPCEEEFSLSMKIKRLLARETRQ